MRKIISKGKSKKCPKCNKKCLYWKMFDDGNSEYIHERKLMKIGGVAFAWNIIKVCYIKENQ